MLRFVKHRPRPDGLHSDPEPGLNGSQEQIIFSKIQNLLSIVFGVIRGLRTDGVNIDPVSEAQTDGLLKDAETMIKT